MFLVVCARHSSSQDLTERNFSKAEALMEEGGDWDRRNRLKVRLHLTSTSPRQ